MRVWFDREGDYLEIVFTQAKGYFREIDDDIYERVDKQGKLIGFAIFNFTKRDKREVEIPFELPRLAT